MASSCFSSLISRSYFLISCTESFFTLSVASLETRAIRCANLHVDSVSSSCASSPQMLAISSVLQLPPSESFRTCVSLEERYGTWSRFFSDSATMTCSRNVRDLLMWVASFSTLPVLPVFSTRSLPARSTRCSLDTTTSSLSGCDRLSRYIVNSACERLEFLFIWCCAIARAVSPSNSAPSASASPATCRISTPRTWMAPLPSSTTAMCEGSAAGFSRS
mmetsp:Transcript_24140/g.60767  ORF Transcript_24140/g.60767 Transcript_24140/m.60767 type:complete len:219 (+) Transcript_24140:457-1113(+)